MIVVVSFRLYSFYFLFLYRHGVDDYLSLVYFQRVPWQTKLVDRGGKGGGDWPPMSELKAWFVEKKVKVDFNESPMPEQDESDDMAEGEMEGSMPPQMDMFQGIGSNMAPFNMETGYDLAVDGIADPAIMASVNGELISAPISSASGNFGFSPFSNASTIHGVPDNYAFSEHATSAYGSNLSSSNTITPATFQDMSHMSMADNGLWVS
jgi:hypothetical protein